MKLKKRMPAAGMPIRRLTTAPAGEEITVEDLENEPSEAEIQDAEQLNEFQSQFGGQRYTIRVQRYNEETSELEIIDRVLLDSFDPYFIGKKYGGGRFVCTLFNDKGKYVENGRLHFVFARQILVEEKKSPMQDPMMLVFIEQMKSQISMLSDILKASLTSEKQTPIDQMVAALKGLHDMNPVKKDDPFKNLKDLFEMQALIQSKSGRDDEDEKGGVRGVMSEIVEAAKILTQGRTLPAARPPQFGGVPTISKPLPKKEDPLPVATNDDIVLKKLLVHVPSFEEAAEKQADPEKWASYLIDVLDTQIVPALVEKYMGFADEDTVWEKLIAASESEEKVAKIFDYAPSLGSHKEWVGKVIQAAVRQFDGDGEPEPPEIPVTVNGHE
jgi:hypothetical protein